MKYYVTFGERQIVTNAGNPYQACIITLKSKLDTYTDTLFTQFRVSKRGFDEHENDEIITLEEIVKIMELSSQGEEISENA